MTKRGKLTIVLVILLSCIFYVTPNADGPTLSYYFTVVIDPGHGGYDPGAVGIADLCEKELTTSISDILYARSMSYPSLRVLLTRRSDTYIDPRARAEIANMSNADVFLSIHANACDIPSVSGFETLVARSSPAHEGSLHLAKILQEEMEIRVPSRSRGVAEKKLFTRYANMPAALVEIGFVTNPTEANNLQSFFYQDRIADALLQGILRFLDEQ